MKQFYHPHPHPYRDTRWTESMNGLISYMIKHIKNVYVNNETMLHEHINTSDNNLTKSKEEKQKREKVL